MHLAFETTPKNPPICYREMCLVFWPQNYNFYPKSHICKRFPFINKLVKKTQSPSRSKLKRGLPNPTLYAKSQAKTWLLRKEWDSNPRYG